MDKKRMDCMYAGCARELFHGAYCLAHTAIVWAKNRTVMRKVRKGDTDPIHEKFILKMLGIEKLK